MAGRVHTPRHWTGRTVTWAAWSSNTGTSASSISLPVDTASPEGVHRQLVHTLITVDDPGFTPGRDVVLSNAGTGRPF